MVCKHYNHNSIDTQLLSFFSRLTILIITKCNVKIMPTLKKRRRKSCKMWEIISAEHERLQRVWRRKPTLVHFRRKMRRHFSKWDEASVLMFRSEFPFDVETCRLICRPRFFSFFFFYYVKVEYFRFSVTAIFSYSNCAFNSFIVPFWSDIFALLLPRFYIQFSFSIHRN